MALLENMERSNEANLLWPPIAEAVDTFIKRRACLADGYERTWRLIHVWESIALTLSAAVSSRLKSIPSESDKYLKCREFLYGKTWSNIGAR